MNIACFVFITSLSSSLLVYVLHVEEAVRGQALGSLQVADQLMSIIMCPLWGYSADRIGLRNICSLGLSLMGVAIILSPFSSSLLPTSPREIVWSLICYRILFSVGGSAVVSMVSAFSVRLSRGDSASKFAGYLGIMSSLGAIFSGYFMNRLITLLYRKYSEVTSLKIVFVAMGITMVLSSLATLFIMTEPCSLGDESEDTAEKSKDTKSIVPLLSGALARTNTVSPHLFVPLWVSSYVSSNMASTDNFLISKKRTAALLGTCQLFVFLLAPIVGIAGRKFDIKRALEATSTMAALSYSLLFCINDPMIWSTMAVMVLVGAVQICSVIFSMAFFIQSSGQGTGRRSGWYNFSGSMGIIMVSGIGGYISDRFGRAYAFLAIAAMNIAYAIVSLINK